MGKVKKTLVFLLVAALTLGSVSMSAFAATTKKAVVSVSVTNVPYKVITLKKGTTYTLATNVVVTGNADKSVIYSTSNKTVATVGSTGKIYAKKNGTAYIYVTSRFNKTKKATIKVVVGNPVSKVYMNTPSATVVLGNKLSVKAVTNSSASVKNIHYFSSNKSVATVDPVTGVVSAKKAGKAIIYARAKDNTGKYDKCIITVVGKVDYVTASNVKYNLTLTKGSSYVLKPSVKVSGANVNTEVVYASSNKKIATVSSSGVIKAIAKGACKVSIISKADPTVRRIITVFVGTKISAVKLPSTSKVAIGSSITLKPTITPSTASYKTLVWKSSDTSIATVSSKGVVTGKKAGTVTITATSLDNTNKVAVCKVTVTRKLIFSDEFNGTSLDMKKWNYEVHEKGWVNNELQEYVAGTDNTYLENGHLVIKANKDGDRITSGRINTQSKFNFKYGRVEARIKFPEGKGLLPAFWMMPQDESLYGQWPKCGEIDIAEVLGDNTKKLYSTIHFGEENGSQVEKQGALELKEGSLSDSYHVIACEWQPDSIKMYMDGKLVAQMYDWFTRDPNSGEYTFPAPFDQPFYIIFNLAVGGNWPGNPDETLDYDKAKLEVDYVRVYQNAVSTYNENVTKPIEEIVLREPVNGNYIYNGDFATEDKTSGKNNWDFLTALGGEAEFTVDTENKELVVNTISEGTADYSVQVVQPNMPLEQAGEYKISFDAYAEEERDIYIALSAPDRGWIKYFDENGSNRKVTVGTAKEGENPYNHYEFTFTMNKRTDGNARFELNLGKCNSTARLHITNIKLEKTGQGEVVEEPKSVLGNGNYVYNGTFDQGEKRLGYWTVDGLSATVTNVNNIREFTATGNGTLSQDIAVSENKDYGLSFNARSTVAKKIKVTVADQEFEFDLTTANKNFEVKFKTAETIDKKDIIFDISGSGRVYLDNVRVAEQGLVVNGSFSNGKLGWKFFNNASATYEVDSLTEPSTVADITINSTGDQNWTIQLNQDGADLKKDVWYKFSYRARTTYEGGRKMEAAIKHNGESDNDWSVYSSNDVVDLTNEWNTYSSVFKMPKDDVVRIGFQMGNCGEEINTTHHIYIDDITLEVYDPNVITNGDFANGFDGWSEGYDPGAGGDAVWSVAEDGAKVVINNVGTANYAVQLSQVVALEKGGRYIISFDVNAGEARNIEIGMGKTTEGGWIYYGGFVAELTAGNNHVEKEVTITENTADDVNFQINLGLIGEDAEKSINTTLVFNNIKMEKQLAKPPVESGTELIKSPDFSSDWEANIQGTATGSKSLGDGKAVFDITDYGTDSWHVQLSQKGIQLENGATYTVSFKVKTSVERTIQYALLNSSFNWYGGDKVIVTPKEGEDLNVITKDITITEASDDNISFVISMGKLSPDSEEEAEPINANGIIEISEVSIIKQ